MLVGNLKSYFPLRPFDPDAASARSGFEVDAHNGYPFPVAVTQHHDPVLAIEDFWRLIRRTQGNDGYAARYGVMQHTRHIALRKHGGRPEKAEYENSYDTLHLNFPAG